MSDHPEDDSPFIGHEPCPKCGSRDNLARYASGRGYCHGCDTTEWPEGGLKTDYERKPRIFNPIEGEYMPIAAQYGINLETCKKLGIKIVPYAALDEDKQRRPTKKCISFDYRLEDQTLWGQKIRYKISEDEKTFGFPHADGKPPLWLMNKWGTGADTRGIVIFEGEGDAAAYYQVTGGKYPVVSLPTGAKGSIAILKNHYKWLDRFDRIILVFDDDKTGDDWAAKASEVLPPRKAYLGKVQGHKDARSALMAGDTKAIQQVFFNCERYSPAGIFKPRELAAEARKPVVQGFPWAFPTLTKYTFGRRWGELYSLGAGNSIGKTDFTTQNIAFDVFDLKLPVAVIYLEQPPVETLKRLAGKIAGRQFHIPAEDLEAHERYTQEELDLAIDKLEELDNLTLAGNFESTAWEDVEKKIRYLQACEGSKVFYLDNMTALIDESKERASVEKIIKEMALLCQELGIIIILLCHLATPEGKPHEEGGQVSLKHFKGSRAMGAWPHYAFGLERNTQHSDPDMRQYSILRVVKDRYTGRYNGATFCLHYDHTTGQQQEVPIPEGLFETSDGPPTKSSSFKPYEGGGFTMPPDDILDDADDVPF